MSDFELSESYHQFFKKTFSQAYLRGHSWHGHNQIPSAIKSGELHYIAVISDEFSLHSIREEVISFHQNQASASSIKLYCVHQKSFENYLTLNPTFASRLHQLAWRSSKSIAEDKKEYGESLGWFAWQLMQVTADLYHDQSNNLRLRSLLPSIETGFENGIKPSLTASLNQLFNRLPEAEKINFKLERSFPSPIDFPAPVAIYLKLDQLILVSNDPAATFDKLNKEKLEAWMDEYSATAVQVCTPSQLILAIESEDLVTARLMSYQHIWGDNLLNRLSYDRNKILKGAANVASYWQLYGIGQRLFSTPASDDGDRKTIHDLQNRLLNIRLQNELFSRFDIAPKGWPDVEIPDRSRPLSERLQAIEDLFDWWADFYIAQIGDE